MRQSRPGLIFLAYLITKPIKPTIDFLWDCCSFRISAIPNIVFADKFFKEFPATYTAYLIINLGLLSLAMGLWRSLFGQLPNPLALPLLLLVWFNSIVKIFLFSPHTQIFNILVPVVSYWIACQSKQIDFPWQKRTYGIIAALGLGLCCYGTFIIPAIVFGVMCLWHSYLRSNAIPTLWRLSIHGLIFAAPLALWSLYVIACKGTIYFHESESCHQFVWMPEVLAQQGWLALGESYLGNLRAVMRSGAEFWPVTGTLIGAAWLWGSKEALKKYLPIGLLVLLGNWLLLAAMGFYPWRLAFTLHLPLWIASSLVLNSVAPVRKELVWGAYLLILTYGAYVVVSPASF